MGGGGIPFQSVPSLMSLINIPYNEQSNQFLEMYFYEMQNLKLYELRNFENPLKQKKY